MISVVGDGAVGLSGAYVLMSRLSPYSIELASDITSALWRLSIGRPSGVRLVSTAGPEPKLPELHG